MVGDVIPVRLGLRGLRVLDVLADAPDGLEVAVEVFGRRSWCGGCGGWCDRVHDRRLKRVWDLECLGRPVTLVWHRRRFVCDNCGSRFLEDHPAFENKSTKRLSRRLVCDAKTMTVAAVTRRHKLSWYLVMGVLSTWAELVADQRRRQTCQVLLVDEISMCKRHRYVTVLVNGDTGQTLALIPHRNTAAFSAFLASQEHQWCKQIKAVLTDGPAAYKATIDLRLGHARHLLDRFHVIRCFQTALVAVRRDTQRTRGEPALDPDVFKARFLLLRRGDTLTNTQQQQLDELFKAYPRLGTG